MNIKTKNRMNFKTKIKINIKKKIKINVKKNGMKMVFTTLNVSKFLHTIINCMF